MKFKVVFSILIILIIGAFSYAVYLSFKLVDTNDKLSDKIVEIEEAKKEIEDAKLKYASLEEKAKEDLEKCLNEGSRSKWEIASRTNTIEGYSSYLANCTNCNTPELKKRINSLLNAEGYVQLIETNGNKLYTTVKSNLEGEYIKFKTDKAVRNGAIGIRDCGYAKPSRTGGIVLKGRIVKVLKKCYATNSKSVWVKIQYAK